MQRRRSQFVETLLATSPASSATKRLPRLVAARISVSRGRRFRGFTLLELMIVISVMMILMAVAVPLYQQHVIQAREAVLKQNLFTLNNIIAQYTMDKGQAPQSLDDLVSAGYLGKLPADPMTGKSDWTSDLEDTSNAADPQQPGIIRAHSASTGTALNGEAYSTW